MRIAWSNVFHFSAFVSWNFPPFERIPCDFPGNLSSQCNRKVILSLLFFPLRKNDKLHSAIEGKLLTMRIYNSIHPRFKYLCNLIGQVIEEERIHPVSVSGILIYKLINRGCRSLKGKKKLSVRYLAIIPLDVIFGWTYLRYASRPLVVVDRCTHRGHSATGILRRPSPRGSAILGRGWERVIGFPWRQKTPRSKTSSRSKLRAAVTRGEERDETRNEDSEALRSYYH